MSNTLNNYKDMIIFLGEAFGPNYEFVLQDCRPKSSGIIAIVNGNVTNRKVGGGLTDYAKQIISSGIWKENDSATNYLGKFKNTVLRCSTYFIKENNELVGMLCINMDIANYVSLSEGILNLVGLKLDDVMGKERLLSNTKESFLDNIPELVESCALELFGPVNEKRLKLLNQEERVQFLGSLDKKGFFNIKGAVLEIAHILDCSEPTIYRCLSKYKREDHEKN